MTQNTARIRRLDDDAPVRVLFADPHEDTRELYAEYFEHCGFVVAIAADAGGAISRAIELRPDVVVTDIEMPRGGGVRVLRELRARGSTPLLIVLTSTEDDRLRDRARAAGYDVLLIKPYSPDALVDRIRRELANRPRPDAGGTR